MDEERPLRYWVDRIRNNTAQSGVPVWKEIAEAFEHVTESADKGLYGLVCYLAAYCRLMEGSQTDAIGYLSDSIRCLPGTGQEPELSRCYNLLGIIAHGQNNLILAMEQYDAALMYAQQYGMKMVHSMITSNMADAYYRMGAYDRAVGCYKDCIREYEASGDESPAGSYNIQLILAGYGYCLVMAGRLEEAVQTAERLWSRMQREGGEVPVLAAYNFFALLCFKLGDTAKAEACMERAVGDVWDNVRTLTAFDNVLDLLDFLIMTERFDRLREVLDRVEPQVDSDGNDGLLLQLLLLRMEYCSEGMAEEEFMRTAGRFLDLKERCEAGENDHVLRMLKLRKKLRNISQERQALETQNTELLFRARHDQLTGLPNRGELNRCLEQAFAEAVRDGKALGIMFVDIDCFKEMNDRYGHQSGDRCIAAVAEAIRQAAPGEFAARYGGDEFVVVTKDRKGAQIRNYAERIGETVKSMRIPNEDSAAGGFVTVSIGAVNGVPGEKEKVWDFLRAADETLYEQKKEAKGGYKYRGREAGTWYGEGSLCAAEQKL